MVMEKHLKFIARIVVVQARNWEAGHKTLSRIFTRDGTNEDMKR